MIGPTNWKNWLTFGGDLVADRDSRSLFHFPYHCGIGDFGFSSLSHTVTSNTRWNDRLLTSQLIHNISGAIWQTSGPKSRIQIQINPEIWIWIPDHFWLTLDTLVEDCNSEHGLVVICGYDKYRNQIMYHRKLQKKLISCGMVCINIITSWKENTIRGRSASTCRRNDVLHVFVFFGHLILLNRFILLI